MTVAMILANNGIAPLRRWYYDPELRDKNNYTIEDYLSFTNINIS